MPVFRVNGVDYYAKLQGAGTPLVLLHGFTGSSSNWATHINALAQKYQVIAIDLLGHGQTDAPEDPQRYAIHAASDDIAMLVNQMELKRIDLLGYSMGGRLALYTALRYPEMIERLILESASPGLETDVERAERVQRDEALAIRILRDGIPSFVREWESLPLFATQKRLPDAVLMNQRSGRLANREIGLANSLIGMGTGAQPSLWSRLPELKMPIQLIAGGLDKKFVETNQRMNAILLNAHLTIIPDAGHTCHLEQPEAFQHCVLEFLGC